MKAAEAGRDIVSRRILEAPRERVWEAFSNPETLARWWGPSGFTNVFETFDLRPEGEWRFTMRGPDGGEYAMRKVFAEVEAPDRLVFDHPDPEHGHRMFLEFADAEGGTEVLWTMRFDSADEAQRVRAFVQGANEQNLDRLREILSQ